MDLLQEIQVSGTRKNPFAEVALERLLDANLSAKYALTGQLSMYYIVCNRIAHRLKILLHVSV
jgi:hypothetical protein